MKRVVVDPVAGVELAVRELTTGGQGGGGSAQHDLLLVHATGLHGDVWRPFVEHLPSRFRPLAMDVRGHGRSGPLPHGGMAWQELATDVLAVVDSLELRHPLGVGHSSGASLLLLAEELRPDTFAGLLCIEPIGMPVDDPPPPNPAHPLAEGARRRRDVFASRQAAFDTYATKPPFSRVAPEALWAYVEEGFSDRSGDDAGVQLRCRPEGEAAMYAHGLSHHAYRDLNRVRCPIVLACGEHSNVVTPDVLAGWAERSAAATVEVLPGVGHFAPLEDPAGTARAFTAAFGGA